MRIGELAKRAGCQTETVRYYEREGLLPEPARTDGNYRLYDATHLGRLAFIRNCRALEMSLTEIRALLAIKDGAGRDCGAVNALLEAHIGHVASRIEQLAGLKAQLVALREQCGGVASVDRCGILRGLGALGTPEEGRCPSLGSPSGENVPSGPPCPVDWGNVCRKKR